MILASELRQAAGSYAAGELDPEEAAAFEAMLPEDAQLDRDCAFWEQLRPQMPAALRPSEARGPGPGFAAAVMSRVARVRPAEAFEAYPAGAWAQAGWAVAAAAVLALAVTISQAGPIEVRATPIAFDQDGGGVVLPADWQAQHPASLGTFMPVRLQNAEVAAGGPTHRDLISRPWLGIWTRPIHIKNSNFEHDYGLQVLRVTADGPAWAAGLRPGDVLLMLGNCPMRTRYCIVQSLAEGGFGVGDQIALRFWRPGSDTVFDSVLTLAAALE